MTTTKSEIKLVNDAPKSDIIQQMTHKKIEMA